MSEEKKLKARVVHKHKTYAEWYLDVYDESGKLRSNPFIPLNGELIIFDPDENCVYRRKKYGDGVSNVMELPFAEEIYVGDGDMPDNAVIQFIMDGVDEEQALKDDLKDYITEEIVKRGQLKPEFANSLDELKESGDASKLYVLPDGYIYAYMSKDTPENVVPNFTNLIETVGYTPDTYISSSSGEPSGKSGYGSTGFIQIPAVATKDETSQGLIVLNLANIEALPTDTSVRLAFYDSSKNFKVIAGSAGWVNAGTNGFTPYKCNYWLDENGYINKLDLTSQVGTLGGADGAFAFVRFCAAGLDGESIVTLNEEIEYTTTGGTSMSGWTNTGHAFVPADYEDRIVELETDVSKLNIKSTDFNNRISSLEASETVSVPTYVIAEAERVANEVLSVRNAHSFVFGAISDIHSTGSDVSILHAGQGIREIDKLTTLDACLNFGDCVDVYFENANADSFLHIRKCLHDVARAMPYIQMQGNHDQLTADTTEDAQQKYFAYIGANNIGTVTDWDNRFRNYGYRDFPDQRIRVIYLNSIDVSEGENTDDCWLTAMQLSWLVNTALDFTDKEGWAFIVGCHHPLNWWHMDNLLTILNAYKGKASGSITVNGTTVNYNFTNATAEFIAHFHGHLHNFRVETLGSNDVLSITIPNACFGRNNEYGTYSGYTDDIKTNYGDVDKNGVQRQFNKTTDTAEDTAFNVVVIDRDNEKIHCFNYGAGIDRVVSFAGVIEPEEPIEPDTPTPSFTNQIPLSVNADGTEYVGHNGEDGYSAGYRVNSSGVEEQQSGMCCTGFIPYDDNIIRLKNITVAGAKTSYLVEYYADKSCKQVRALTDVLQDDGTGVLKGSTHGCKFIRVTCGVIDDTSILTIDEEIV